FVQQIRFRSAPEQLMVENEQPRLRLRRQLRELPRGSMIARVICLPLRRPLLESFIGINFVNQNITSVAVLDDAAAWRAVTRDDDGSIGRLEAISERMLPRAVIYLESLHRQAPVLEDNAGSDLVRHNSIARRI